MSGQVLALIHQEDAPAGVLGDVVHDLGHELEVASLALGRPPSRPAHEYDATIVLGGAMNVDEAGDHPWLPGEKELIADLIRRERPLLGVCLGSQLLAEAAGARVGPLGGGPEIGWHEVELLPGAERDPVLGALPRRFPALEWHSYAFDAGAGTTELARSEAGVQAFRAGELPVWGIQFHAEVTEATLAGWIERDGADARAAGVDRERLAAQSRAEIGRWNALGRRLGRAFIEAARR